MNNLFPALSSGAKQLVLIVLVLLNFFGFYYTSFPGFHYIVTFFLIYFAIKYRKVDIPNKIILCLFLLFFFFSCLYSQIYNNQPLYKTIGFSNNYLGILFLFYLLKKNLPSNDILNALVTLALFYCIGYLIQYLVYPFPIFSVANNDGASIEQYRIRINGSICAYFLYFWGINKYLKENKKIYILYSLLGFFPIIIMGFRSLVFLVVCFSILMIPFVTQKIKKTFWYSIVLAICTFGISQTGLVKEKIDEMMERQLSDQTFQNEDYIRIRAYEYFTEVHFTKPGERILGGGIPAGKTKYAEELGKIAEYDHLYWVDWGLVGLSWIIGPITVTFLILYYIITAFRCKDSSIQFVRFTLILLVLGSLITTMELYRNGNILLASLLLYYTHKYNKEKKELTMIRSCV